MALAPPAIRHDLLVRALRGETVERTPVWAMRQAGRWDPEFQKLRAGLSFFEFSENAELAAQASLCPKWFGSLPPLLRHRHARHRDGPVSN